MRTLLISDIHLSEKRPDLTRALLNFLHNIHADCDHLYLLGDIFDAWIGDDCIHPDLIPVIDALHVLAEKGINIFFQHGNRDFLVGHHFATRIGAKLLAEEAIVSLPDGQSALLMHGDQLCIDDTEYQQFRKVVRNSNWQREFLGKPLQERMEIARSLRAASKERNAEKSLGIMDVNADCVRNTLQRTKCELLIHGHTHRPAIHHQQLNDHAGTRIVLGDWDTSLWYLSCTSAGCELLHEPISTD